MKNSSSLFFALLFVLFIASGCSRTDREQEVFKLIEEGIAHAESHDLGSIMDLTSDEFVASPGKYSRKDVRRLLFVILKRYGRFKIHYPQPSVNISDDENRAVVKMNFLISNKDEIFPSLKSLYDDASSWLEAVDKNADLFTLSMELSYDSGEWLIRKVRVTRFGRPHGRL